MAIAGQGSGASHPDRRVSVVQLAANLGVLAIALVNGLGPWQLLIVYWWEGVWIGLFNALRILTASLIGRPWDTENTGVSRGAGLLLSLLLVGFFGAKYLGFLGAVGIALLLIPTESGWADLHELVGEGGRAIALSSGVLVLGHAASFVLEFLVGGEFRRVRPLALLFRPYLRCAGLVVSVIVAGLAAWRMPALANASAFALVVIAVKAGIDLLAAAVAWRREAGRAAGG